ncbi:MAG: CpsB/CapC family capsule biosynthesis tyrosine phosphatase [Thermotogota bacterium]
MKMYFSGNLELAEIHDVKSGCVDMHSHLLPEFDDGVNDLEKSLEIIRQIKQNGAEALFWTPHLNLNAFPDINTRSIKEHYQKFVDLIERETGIQLFCGSELFCSLPIPDSLMPLGESDFVLIEFPLDVFPRYLFDIIYKIQVSGYRVIMAHVERYRWLFPNKRKMFKTITDYSLLEELKNRQVYFQINYSTLMNINLYKELMPILKKKEVEFIGSDKHHPKDNRPVIDFSKIKGLEL